MAESSSLKRFAAEGVLIVLSILIAFGIDAWWDERSESVEELALIEVLEVEAQANSVELRVILDDTQHALDRIDRFLRVDEALLLEVPSDSMALWLRAIYTPRTFDPALTAADVLLSRPFPSSERAAIARPMVAEWVRLLEDSKEERAAMGDAAIEILGLISQRASRAYGEGFESISRMATRLGPEFLSVLRRDSVFLGYVGEKAHYQRLYLGELRSASEKLDDLIGELARVR